jgi:hypothetical protein
MIRVRYKELSPGLHGQAESGARGTVIYLRPGLTGGQRSAALRRLRQEASRGCGPALPGPDLTVALAADRCRAGLRNTVAVVRQHPAGSLVPTLLAALLMTLFVLASMSSGVVQLPQSSMPGELFSVRGGEPTVVGSPVLAQKSRPDDSSADAPWIGGGVWSGNLGGSQGIARWSLVASSTTVSKQPSRHLHQSKSQLGDGCQDQADGVAGAFGDSPVLAAGAGQSCPPARASRSPAARDQGSVGVGDFSITQFAAE